MKIKFLFFGVLLFVLFSCEREARINYKYEKATIEWVFPEESENSAEKYFGQPIKSSEFRSYKGNDKIIELIDENGKYISFITADSYSSEDEIRDLFKSSINSFMVNSGIVVFRSYGTFYWASRKDKGCAGIDVVLVNKRESGDDYIYDVSIKFYISSDKDDAFTIGESNLINN